MEAMSDTEILGGIMLNTPAPTVEDLTNKIATLEAEVLRLNNNWNFVTNDRNELRQKIDNVQGYIMDMASAGDTITSEIKDIADLLDIELMKEISGTALFEISWSAKVPFDFDADDMEISFSVECESYEAEEFDWSEDNTEVHGEDN
jgi:hypothetical protein